jgi:hypothetical protein
MAVALWAGSVVIHVCFAFVSLVADANRHQHQGICRLHYVPVYIADRGGPLDHTERGVNRTPESHFSHSTSNDMIEVFNNFNV